MTLTPKALAAISGLLKNPPRHWSELKAYSIPLGCAVDHWHERSFKVDCVPDEGEGKYRFMDRWMDAIYSTVKPGFPVCAIRMYDCFENQGRWHLTGVWETEEEASWMKDELIPFSEYMTTRCVAHSIIMKDGVKYLQMRTLKADA